MRLRRYTAQAGAARCVLRLPITSKYFSGVQDVVGIEQSFDLAHQLQRGRAVLAQHVFLFANSHAMLAGARAAQRKRTASRENRLWPCPLLIWNCFDQIALYVLLTGLAQSSDGFANSEDAKQTGANLNQLALIVRGRILPLHR